MASPELTILVTMLRENPIIAPTVEQMRQGIEAMTTMLPVAPDVSREKVDAGGVPAEWIAAPGADRNRVVLYLHGGGYVIGSVQSHAELISRVARAANARALALNYRLAPEHRFPAAVDDAVAAYRWLLAQDVHPSRIVIAGDSAGGGLTLATLIALRDARAPLPAAAVCMSPWVDLEGTGESMTARAELDPMVQKEGLVVMAAHYLGDADAKHPLAAPLHADLSGLPPLLIHVGTAEVLYHDATRFHQKARDAGVNATIEVWDEMIHVFQMFPMLPEAHSAVDNLGRFIREKTAG